MTAPVVVGIAVALVAVVVGGPLLLFYVADRRETRRALERYAREVAVYKAHRAEWEKADEARETERKKLLTLSWRELREACEVKTGKPCECATKSQVAQRLLGPRLIMPLPPPRLAVYP